MFKNILIIGHSNIGDVCYDLVVVNPLRRRFAGAKISFLTAPRACGIVEGYKGVDKVFSFDKYAKHRGLFGRLRFMYGLTKQRFDLAIVLPSTLMHKFLFVPCAWSLRKYLRGDPLKKKMHVADIYLEFLRSRGVEAKAAVFDFSWAKEDELYAETFLNANSLSQKDRLIGIHPVPAWSLKSWPIDKWNELAQVLSHRYGCKVISFGKSSGDSFGRMVDEKISREIIIAKGTTLKQAMALIKRCAVFIGPDSSLLHLASCMQVETIGLYGPTRPEYIYPYFHGNNNITCREKPACMPCYPDIEASECKDKLVFGRCMEAIGVEAVLEQVRRYLRL